MEICSSTKRKACTKKNNAAIAFLVFVPRLMTWHDLDYVLRIDFEDDAIGLTSVAFCYLSTPGEDRSKWLSS